MKKQKIGVVFLAAFTVASTVLACNLISVVAPPKDLIEAPPTAVLPSDTGAAQISTGSPPTPTTATAHLLSPSAPGSSGQLVYDVVSEETAPEGRAPYGDSYEINRLERPFTQSMSYLPDLDIWTYTVSSDSTWWYVSIRLIGGVPNSTLSPNYGVELDRDSDGFGDFLIWAQPPFTQDWQTSQVRIYQDTNHDTGGISGERCDAPMPTDGYDALIFNGGAGDADPDMAWVRVLPGSQLQVQFAFKKAWSGAVFMLGVIADAGLKDPAKLDYVDRCTLAEAGSPVRDNPNYPLKALFAVDNCCREAFGFRATGYEPQLCPRAEPTKKPRAPTEQPSEEPPPEGCPDPGDCPYGWAGEPDCYCIPG